MEKSTRIQYNNYEAGGSIMARVASEIGEIARMGAGLIRVAIEEAPKLFDQETSILTNHQPKI